LTVNDNLTENMNVLLADYNENDIQNVLKKWSEVVELRKQLDELEEMLRTRVRTFLKEHYWDKYNDKDTGISATLIVQIKQDIDKKQLKVILSEQQYASILRSSKIEKLIIMTPEMRTRMSKFINH
jgi:hypothetical protein